MFFNITNIDIEKEEEKEEERERLERNKRIDDDKMWQLFGN